MCHTCPLLPAWSVFGDRTIPNPSLSILDRFITYEEEAAIEKVFAKGRMHELAGKSVEVKRATPKGTGPAVGRSQIWRGFEGRPERAALELPGLGSQPQGWTAYGSPPMMSAYGVAGYQVHVFPPGNA